MTILSHEFNIVHVPGQGRDSRLPTGSPSLAGTTLEAQAAACMPGRTLLMNAALPSYVSNYAQFHPWHPDPTKSVPNDHDTWMGIGFWDRQRKRSFIYNDRTGAGFSDWNRSTFSSYLALSHQWVHNPLPAEPIGEPHVYNRSALDDTRGHFYRCPRANRIHRFDIRANEWEPIPMPVPAGTTMPGNYPIVYHEGLDMLLVPDGETGARRLWGYRDGDSAWTDVTGLGLSAYHSLMIYNRKRGDALFVEGGTSARRVRLIDAGGAVHTMPPFDFAVTAASGQNLAYDPTTGNYLAREGKRLWELNPEAEEWRLQTDWDQSPASADWPGNYYGRPFITIDDLDVLIWQNYYGPRLYKPQTVF